MTGMMRTGGFDGADPVLPAPLEPRPGPPGAAEPVFTYSHAGQTKLRRRLIRLAEAAAGRNRLERLYQDWRARPRPVREPVLTAAVRALGLWPQFLAGGYDRIPREGGLVIVANHPFGIVDGLILGHIACSVRPDVKLMVHSRLCQPPEVKDVLLPVDFGGGAEARRISAETRRQAMDWVAAGHVLVIFPAGGVATAPKPLARTAADAAWHPFVARLALVPGARVVPVFFHGCNSRLFQVASHWSYPLRVALIFRETLRRRGRAVPVSVGEAVACTGVPRAEVTAHLRRLTFALAGRRGPRAEEEFVFPARIRW